MTLTADRLRSLVVYDPETGVFTRRIRTSPRTQIGDVAGGLDAYGYVVLRVDCRSHKAHRLAWLYVTGEWPTGEIDHIDTDRANNKFANLRDVTHTTNVRNTKTARRTNKTGILGVHVDRRRYKAVIRVNGVRLHLGMFDTPEEASRAYLTAKRFHHEGAAT